MKHIQTFEGFSLIDKFKKLASELKKTINYEFTTEKIKDKDGKESLNLYFYGSKDELKTDDILMKVKFALTLVYLKNKKDYNYSGSWENDKYVVKVQMK